jgi:hypothetical protein
MHWIALVVATALHTTSPPVGPGEQDAKGCRDFAISGSRIRNHVCRTAMMWAKIDAEAQERAGPVRSVHYRPAVLANSSYFIPRR